MSPSFRAEKGFDKWTKMASAQYDLINFINDENFMLRFRTINLILYSIIYAFLAVMFFNNININLFELFIPIANCLLVFTGSTKWTIQQFEKLETSSLLHFPVFYILSGMILYYSGTFFIFGLETIFRYTKSPTLLYFWYINLLLLFIYRLSFYIAIWKAKKV
jgi:hypothetical protein